MKSTSKLSLFLLVAVITSVAVAPASEAAWFKSFGKPKIVRLKKSTAFGTIGSGAGTAPMAMNASRSAMMNVGGGATAVNTGIATEVAQPVADKMAMPYYGEDGEYGQVEVDYNWTVDLPAFSGSSDVYHAIRAKADMAATRSILKNAGLPSGIVDGMNDLQSLNASWKTKDGINWSADVVNGNISWWKESNYPVDYQKNPELDKDRALKVAQEFVKAKGLSQYATSKAEIENAPWIQYLTEGTSASAMPCPMVKEMPMVDPAVTTVSSSGTASTDAAPTIAPVDRIMPPCFWYPRTVNIVYPDIRDGKRVTDAWSGYPQQAMTVTVSLDTYEVTGGWINVPTSIEASSYPLVDKQVVIDQLKAGGRNPYYGWGKKGTRTQIQYNSFEFVLMRYDSWKDNRNETYFVPAISAVGTVDRGDGQGLSEYRTVVPLVKAEFLEPVPSPIMYMKAEPGVVPPAAISEPMMAR